MKSKSHERSWMVTLPAAALALGYVFLSFLPTQRKIDALSAELCRKKDRVAQSGVVAAGLETSRRRLERTEAYNTAWRVTVPSESELASVFGEINALVTASGSTSTRFDPEPAIAIDTLRRVPVTVGCTGSFSQIADFLTDLERLPHMIWVERLEFESRGEDGGSVECELDVTIFADNPGDSDQVDLAG